MLQIIHNKIKEIVKNQYNIETDILVEVPKVKEHGDYSCNVALKLSKIVKQNPVEIAETIKSQIQNLEILDSVQVVKPGFINFFINDNYLIRDTLGKIYAGKLIPNVAKNKKVVIEHTSVNPNKSMHIGHIRNAILGDSINRLLKRVGYNVEVHNYIDDTGVQVADTVNGILNLNIAQPSNQKFDDYCWDIYTKINKEYEKNSSLLENRKTILKAIENDNTEISETVKEVVDKIVACHLELMNSFGINYDLLVYEKDIINFGFWDVAFELLKKSDNFVFVQEGKNKGCWVLKYENEKFEDKVFVRADGTKVYTAKDTAYHLWKFGVLDKDFLYKKFNFNQDSNIDTYRTFINGEANNTFGKADTIVNVIDERQSYPQEMVKHALYSLGYTEQAKSYNHIAYGVVSLSKDTAQKLNIDTSDSKNSYAMSGRKGIGVKVTDLVDLIKKEISNVIKKSNNSDHVNEEIVNDIAIGSIKHYMLKNNPNSEVLFDFEGALKLVGNTGPYIQYSHARANSLLITANENDLLTSYSTKKLLDINKYSDLEELSKELENIFQEFSKLKLTPTERDLLNKLAELPIIINLSLEEYNISLISNYAFELSKCFHSFYENNNVLKSSKEVMNFRLNLIKAYTIVIKDVLDILGIPAPEKM